MAGRCSFPWPVLATLAVLAAAPLAPAAPAGRPEPVARIQTAGDAPLDIWADKLLYHWADAAAEIYVLEGPDSFVRQGQTEVRASWIAVWIDRAAKPKNQPVRVQVYADQHDGKPVRIDRAGEPRQTVPAAVLEFGVPAIGRARGTQKDQSLADTPAYARACAAAGRPVQARPGPDVEPAQFVQPPVPKDPPPDPDPDLPPKVIGPTVLPVPATEDRSLFISPRTGRPFSITNLDAGKESVYAVTGGVKLQAKFAKGSVRSLTVEADQVIIWQKGGDAGPALKAMRSEDGTGADGVELYLTGNVVIRYGGLDDVTKGTGIQKQSKTLRADRVYYDVDSHKAIAVRADLEFTKEGFPNAGHLMASEIYQLSGTEFKAAFAEIHASRLPSDPGLKIAVREADVYREPRRTRQGLFGNTVRDRLTGEDLEEDPDILEARGIRTKIFDVPVSYWPSTRTNLNDPLGPFKQFSVRQDRQFGAQVYTTWDVLELLGIMKLPQESWNLNIDYLSRRGPALGTDYSLTGKTWFGEDAPFTTLVKAYVIQDAAKDIIAGPRTNDFEPTSLRGRFLWRHQQQFGDVTWQSQIALLSDRNFYEQYYKFDYDLGPNQETFFWVKHQSGQHGGSVLFQPGIGRDWVTETEWLPKAEGHLIGQSLFERFTYHTWGSVGYARLDPFRNPPQEFPLGIDAGVSPPREPKVETGRVDWMQQLALPLAVGSAKVVPYLASDVGYYTNNNNQDGQGRAYAGAGVRASVPLSKLYADVTSELFNLQGLYHKNLFSANYYAAVSKGNMTTLPQLDRLNDDAMESSYRDITPFHRTFPETPGSVGYELGVNPIYDPRRYVLRRLIDFKPDNLDDIHVAQLDWRQRFQTKRGYPGLEHTIDWLTIDTSASVYPTPDRDNFGSTLGFLEYSLLWNVGDRTGVFSNGWLDPFDRGAVYYNVGTFFSRDDRTSFNVSYRHADPIHSRTLSGGVSYVFSPKYAMTAFTAYDFGSRASLSNTVLFTRVGTDVQITFGFNYNYLINTFGFTFGIVPNLIAGRDGGVPGQRGAGGIGGSNANQDRR